MTITVHQPHFLPWIGYLNKIINSDIFVVLDTVQFRKNYFQNRVLIKNRDGTPLWLSVPVRKSGLETPISDIEVSEKIWTYKATKTIESLYSKTSYFSKLYPSLQEILTSDFDKLAPLNIALIKWLLEILQIKTELHVAGNLQIKSEDPNDRLLQICKYFNATIYIAGKGGCNYMDEELFRNNGINVIFQAFNPSAITYKQLYGDFVPGLSAIDLLFNEGPNKSLEIIKNAWRIDVRR